MAVTSAGYLRFPHIRGDLVAFVADDDVWIGPADGGRAWRISADRAPASHPRISADGTALAWASRRDGPPEVYQAGIDGADSCRLTYWSDTTTRVCGWSPDGEVLAVSAAGQPFSHLTHAYAVPSGAAAGAPDGTAAAGVPRLLPFGPVTDLALDASRVALLTGSFGREPAYWKRYRGGTAGRLWLAAQGAAEAAGTAAEGAAAGEPSAAPGADQPGAPAPRFTRLLAGLGGQLACPMLVEGRAAFLSDHEGTGNIYSCAPDGSDLRRHTDHDGFYARNPSTDGRRIVYHCAGEIWLLGSLAATAQPQRLELRTGPRTAREPRLISAGDHLGALSCDQVGQGSAIEVRGTVHWLTHRDGPARALAATPGVRARLPRVLGGTGRVVWVTDAPGADTLEIGRADGTAADDTTAGGTVADSTAADGEALGTGRPQRLAAGQLGWVAGLAAAPDGSAVAVASYDGRLRVVDTASGTVTELAAAEDGEITGLAWSPDSAWLAWSEPTTQPLTRLRIARPADPGQITDVTDGRFADTDPVFTPDGLYLAFLSRRSFDPVYDAHFFDLSFPYGCRPYLVPLASATPSPFAALPDGRPIPARPADDAEAADGSGAAGVSGPSGEPAAAGLAPPDSSAPPVTVDTDGLTGRIVVVPVPESRYSSLRAVKGGLAWLREPVAGNLGEGGASPDDATPRAALLRFDFGQQRCTELADELDWFETSGDGRLLIVSDHGDLSVVPADRKPDPDSPADRIEVDTTRARFLADPAALWRNAYDEAGRIMRHDFWVPDMAGVDWDSVLAQYRPLLDQIATPADFADLMWEVLGELGTSHAYVAAAEPDGADHHGAGRGTSLLRLGLLGAETERDAAGIWRISRVLPGESSDPRARSPLETPGAAVVPGDVLVAIDGRPVTAAGPGPLLVGAAGKPVELSLRPAAAGPPRRVVVVPLADERRLRYHDWVAGRRRAVRELSGGRVGYLHIPDMVSEGWADFHRDLHAEMIRDALILDVRGNRGGHTSELVVEKLARRVDRLDLAA